MVLLCGLPLFREKGVVVFKYVATHRGPGCVLACDVAFLPIQTQIAPSFLAMNDSHHTIHTIGRDLAYALKRLFQRTRKQYDEPLANHPMNIIRRVDATTSDPSRVSQVSLFPDFQNADLGAETSSISVTEEPFDDWASMSDTGNYSVPPRRLLPAPSLSHLRSTPGDPPRPLRHKPTYRPSEIQASRAQQHAIKPHSPRLARQKSTLLIRRQQPTSTLQSVSESTTLVGRNASIRRRAALDDLRKCADMQAPGHDDFRLTLTTDHSRSDDTPTSEVAAGPLIRHFATFCIIDISTPGCLISAVSEDLQFVYDSRDRFVLNAQECSELSMDVSVGRDRDGNAITYVLLYSPLISPSTSKSHFIMVCAVDVTNYISYAASLDSKSKTAEQLAELNKVGTGSRSSRLQSSSSGRCRNPSRPEHEHADRAFLPHPRPMSPSSHGSVNINTAIGHEASLNNRRAGSRHNATLAKKYGYADPAPGASSSSTNRIDYSDEDVLLRFVQNLQLLYSEYFLLASTPSNEQFYEICYVSPAVYASGEWVSGHLSHTPAKLISNFASYLAAGRRFSTVMRWGSQGIRKKLYCVPLIGSQPGTWICVLIDRDTPIYW